MEPAEKPPDPLELPPVLRVTPEEAARATPPPPRLGPAVPPPPPPRGPRTSRLALFAFIVGIAGIPLTGLVGLLAIVAGALGLAATRSDTGLRGTRMAVSGMVQGIVSLFGWTFVLWHFLGKPLEGRPDKPPRILEAAGGPPPNDIRNTPEPYRSPLLANVVIMGSTPSAQWNGSGIVVDREGGLLRIATNRHVSEPPAGTGGQAALWILLSNGETALATPVWRAADGIDLAVVEVRATRPDEIPSVRLRSGGVRYGDEVFAVGNPLEYRWSLTKGVVSSIRDVEMQGRKVKVFQTQTPISPGNSGGGLYAPDGRLIGVNTWAADKSVSEGLGFSISAETFLQALEGEKADWARRLRKEAAAP